MKEQGIRLADARGRCKVIGRDGDVLELKMLHADEEQREMRTDTQTHTHAHTRGSKEGKKRPQKREEG